MYSAAKKLVKGIHPGGEPHSVSHHYLQGYLDEFCYRINRSIHKNTIFDNLIQRMVYGTQVTKNQIKFAYV